MSRAGQVSGRSSTRSQWLTVLLVGAAMQMWFWWRAVWLYRDQVELYRLGLGFASSGQLQPFGKLATGDIPIPGVLLQLVVGIPLALWQDFRAPTLMLIVTHALAACVLSRTLSKDVGGPGAVIFLGIFWLSPWRLYHSGFLWEASYMFLPAALHLWACRALASAPSFGASFVLAATLVGAAQIHGSVLILIVATVILLLRQRIRIDRGGALCGLLAGGLTLMPTLWAVATGGSPPGRPSLAGELITRLNSVEKGLLYWFRLPSLDLGRRFRQSVFCIEPGNDQMASPLLCGLSEVTQVLGLASVVVAVVAMWWLVRQPTRSISAALLWYRQYCLVVFLAVLIGGFLSPFSLQGWHVLIAMPAACIPPTLWIRARWPGAGGWKRTIMALFIGWRIPASLLLLGHPMYARPTEPSLPAHIVPSDLRSLVESGDRDRDGLQPPN